ncbi:MAG: hypothetical protein AVDCRST_MAG49-2512, partial [uncultured Thermomicrobiales bacterium]
ARRTGRVPNQAAAPRTPDVDRVGSARRPCGDAPGGRTLSRPSAWSGRRATRRDETDEPRRPAHADDRRDPDHRPDRGRRDHQRGGRHL